MVPEFRGDLERFKSMRYELVTGSGFGNGGGKRIRRPPEIGPVAPIMGSVHAFFRGLITIPRGCVTEPSFVFRLPATGRSNDCCRLSAGDLALLALAAAPPVTGVSWARLRFRAAIRSTTGGGVVALRGLMGRPFSLASTSPRNAS